MAKLRFAEAALDDLDRLAIFLSENVDAESSETVEIISNGLSALSLHPLIGRPVAHGFRELVISRGRTGYVARYKFSPDANEVLVLAIRHQRELTYISDQPAQ